MAEKIIIQTFQDSFATETLAVMPHGASQVNGGRLLRN